jgi:hypothetical protein
LADTLAKAAKVGGADLVKKKTETETLKDRKARSLSAAFVLACDNGAKLPIPLTAEEKGFTDFLIPFAKQVIDAGGEKYRENMNTLLTALGSGESV